MNQQVEGRLPQKLLSEYTRADTYTQTHRTDYSTWDRQTGR